MRKKARTANPAMAMNDSQPPPPLLCGASYTVIESCFSALDEPDTALTVKVYVSDISGVPEISPADESDNPAGRLPETSDQVTPEILAVRVAL